MSKTLMWPKATSPPHKLEKEAHKAPPFMFERSREILGEVSRSLSSGQE